MGRWGLALMWVALVATCSVMQVTTAQSWLQLSQVGFPATGKLRVASNGKTASIMALISEAKAARGNSKLPSSAGGYFADGLYGSLRPDKTYCATFCSSTPTVDDKCIVNALGDKLKSYNMSMMNQVNWVLNNYAPNSVDSVSACDGGRFTTQDIQAAIWSILNLDSRVYSCRSDYIVSRANAKGRGYAPSLCSDNSAVLAVTYDCPNRTAPLQFMVLVTKHKVLKPSCIDYPACSTPILPKDCIGIPYTSFITSTTGALVDLRGRRNLTCSECVQYLDDKYPDKAPHRMPPGCACTKWPCCSTGASDEAGSGCPRCPAYPAFPPALSTALAQAGGCFSAGNAMTLATVLPEAMVPTMYKDLLPILHDFTSQPPTSLRISTAAARIATIIAKTTTAALIRWFQWACVCRNQPWWYSEWVVRARLQAAAVAVARAYSAAQASVTNPQYKGFASLADVEAMAIQVAMEMALNTTLDTVQSSDPSQCVYYTQGVRPPMQDLAEVTLADELVCAIVRHLASVYYTDHRQAIVISASGTRTVTTYSYNCECMHGFTRVPQDSLGLVNPGTECHNACPEQNKRSCYCLRGQIYSPRVMACALSDGSLPLEPNG